VASGYCPHANTPLLAIRLGRHARAGRAVAPAFQQQDNTVEFVIPRVLDEVPALKV